MSSSGPFWKAPRCPQALALQAQRRSSAPGEPPFVLAEVQRRMLARAQIMRPGQGGVLVHGLCPTGFVAGLQEVFPGRPLTALDWRQPGAAQGQPRQDESKFGGFRQFLKEVSGGLWSAGSSQPEFKHLPAWPGQALPVESGSQGLVWSNLWLHQESDPRAVFQQWHQALAPEGAVFFCTLGPDTARELKDMALHLGLEQPDYADMHDLGDALMHAGFSDPVMEMEKLTLTYRSPQALLKEWHQFHGNCLIHRPKTLLTPARLHAAFSALQSQNSGAGGSHAVFPLTLELVYGHAWKVNKLPKSGVATVDVSAIGGRKTRPGPA